MGKVQIQNVTKLFPGKVMAVNDVSLDIEDGEFVALVGPSGCGKSTTLRMVAGLEEITSGTISIGDRVVNDVPPKDRNIAMVFQNYALYPHMTVYDNMAFALKLRKYPKEKIREKVSKTAAILGIEALLKRKPKALSGGQRQRVAVGRAIARDPEVFLFDEPLSNLDAKLRVVMRAELKKLHQKLKTTTIYVTHDQEEAITLGDRVVVMKDGIIHQNDSPLTVYQNPTNRFVAGFIGTPPMNFFDGHLKSEGRDVVFDGGCFTLRLPESRSQKLAARAGEKVIAGIRPQAMAIDSTRIPNEAQAVLPIQIDVVEPLGERMDLYARVGKDLPVVARIDALSGVAPNSDIDLIVDMTRVHFFEPNDEQKTISEA